MSHLRKIILQLDYHMSSQFAGVAVGLRSGLYKQAGIDLQWLPPCFPGDEAKVVEAGFSKCDSTLWVGSMEQNTLLPAVANGCKVKAVAAMFRRSPLCLAGLPGSELQAFIRNRSCLRVGAHSDTVELLRRLLPNAEVQELARDEKMSALHDGKVDAIQAYDVMETLKLHHDLNGAVPELVHLESPAFPGVTLGYSQVLFAPSAALQQPQHHQTLQDFVRATFLAWGQVIREPKAAAEAVLELQEEGIDHWIHSPSFTEKSVQLCSNYVKETMRCGQLGIIDAERWVQASRWLGAPREETFDDTVWGMDARHVDGHPTAQRLREKTGLLAEEASAKHGRPPKLVIISGGHELGRRHPDGERRLELFASPTASWFSLTGTAAIQGIEVVEVDLPEGAETEDFLRELWSHGDADGIVLAWPLPPDVDADRVCASIPKSKDVDGLHFLSRAETKGRYAPATCGGVMQLLHDHSISVEGMNAVVIGSSRLLGQPLTHLLASQGATVTTLHSRSRDLQAFCEKADLIIAAAGVPRLVKSSWVKNDAVVVNIGTAFTQDMILPDIAPCRELSHARLVVRTVGPISAAMLLHNVAENACTREVKALGATASTRALEKSEILKKLELMPGWAFALNEKGVQVLDSSFWLPCYQGAVDLVQAVCFAANALNHHPNLQITHHCKDGVTVNAQLFTHSISAISEFDFKLAREIHKLYRPTQQCADYVPDVSMADYRYELPESYIAQYPASPRGSSRLLVASGSLFQGRFADLPDLLPNDVHMVCNASQVFAARIFAHAEGHGPVEVMFLSPEPAQDPALMMTQMGHGQTWRCMVRLHMDSLGGQLVACKGAGASQIELTLTVERLHSVWQEDGETDGVEATLRMSCSEPLSAKALFECLGTVPLPPYMRREIEEADVETYQTVFASGDVIGSVAAPTAGLHFTKDVVQSLQAKGVRWSQCALHVGAGTFRPVTAAKIEQHSMHTEMFSMDLDQLQDVIASLQSGRSVIAVGTTSARVLESLYWLGVAVNRYSASGMCLGQWDAYATQKELGSGAPTAAVALQRLYDAVSKQGCKIVQGSTQLCIVPGYKFQVCNALLTNFHQPDSTLMLLVSAFAGKQTVMATYQHALDNNFRFLSYGDATLLFRAGALQDSVEQVLASRQLGD